MPLAVGADKDVSALADMFRPYTALYVGGMGSPKQNFYNQLAQRMGYEKEAAEIQEQVPVRRQGGCRRRRSRSG